MDGIDNGYDNDLSFIPKMTVDSPSKKKRLNLKKAKRFIPLMLPVFLAVLAIGFATMLPSLNLDPRSRASEPDVLLPTALQQKAVDEGKIKVIVKLNPEFQQPTGVSALFSQSLDEKELLDKSQQAVADGIKETDHKVRHEYETMPYMALEVSPQTLFELQKLKGDVVEVVEDPVFEPLLDDSRNLIEVDYLESLSDTSFYTGNGAGLAILDTGVDANHHYLQGQLSEEQACFGECANGQTSEFGPTAATPIDYGDPGDRIHGTLISLTAAGFNNENESLHGISTTTKIIPVRIVHKKCTGFLGTEPCRARASGSDMAAALEWVNTNSEDLNIKAVNISFGGIDPTTLHTNYCDGDILTGAIMVQPILALKAKGIPVFVGAGNEGSTSRLSVPACVSAAVPVGAATKTDTIASFSDLDAEIPDILLGIGESVSIPGAAGPERGTSIASPMVAAAYTILRGMDLWGMDQILYALHSTGTQIADNRPGASGTTYPRIDLKKAYNHLMSGASATSVYTAPTGSGVTNIWNHENSGSTLGASTSEDGEVLQASTGQYVDMALVTAAYKANLTSDARILSVTFCGQQMTAVNTKSTYAAHTTEMWYLLNPQRNQICPVVATFDYDPGDRVLASTIISGVNSQNPLGEKKKAGSATPALSAPIGSHAKAILTGPKNSQMACVISTQPGPDPDDDAIGDIGLYGFPPHMASNPNPPAVYPMRMVFDDYYGSATGGVYSILSLSRSRTVDNQSVETGWSVHSYNSNGVGYLATWSASCVNININPAVTNPNPNPTPTPAPASTVPNVPALTLPANDAIVTSPSVQWQVTLSASRPNPISFAVQVARDTGFTDLVYNNVEVTGTTVSQTSTLLKKSHIVGNLSPATKYYWRIRSRAANGNMSAWSSVRNFKTAILAVNTIIKPKNNVQATELRPVFEWAGVPGATNYTIQYTLANPVTSTSTYTTLGSTVAGSGATTYTPTADLTKASTYTWRVKANSSAYGTSTSVTTATFLSANPPNKPALNLPATGGLLTDATSRTNNVLRPRLSWTTTDSATVTDPATYDIQVAKDNAFTDIVRSRSVPGTDLGGSTATSIKRYWDVDVNLVNATTYYWRVRSSSSTGHKSNWSSTFSFKISLATPSNLSSPANNSTPNSLMPTFDWADVPGATSYSIYIKYDAGTETLLKTTTAATATVLSPSTYTATTNMQRSKLVTWRVRANSSTYGNIYSNTSVFTTPNPPNTSVLSLPVSGATVSTLNPELRWYTNYSTSIPQPDGYDIQISTDSTFVTGTINRSVPGTAVAITSTRDTRSWVLNANTTLAPGTTYHWRVRAKKGTQMGSWSTKLSFKTV